MKKLFTTITLLATLLASIAHANPDQIDLATLDTFTGTSTSNTPGVEQGVMAFGDFNCDGTKDLIMGTPAYATYKGRIYVKFGKSISGATSLSYTTMSWTVLGDASYRSLGTHVHAADVDGDGCDDIIAAGADTGTGYAKIYTFLGDSSRGVYTSTGAYYTLTTSITPDYTLSASTSVGTYGHLLGAIDGASAGQHLSLCSDVTGKCYLIPVANLMNTTSTIEDEASYYIYDNGGGAYSIQDALASGDIDGDGNDDLIVGDNGDDSATIFFGPLSSSSSKQTGASTPAEYFETDTISGEDIRIEDVGGSSVSISNVIQNGAADTYADVLISYASTTVDGVTGSGRYDIICGQSIKNLRDSVAVTTGITLYADTSTGTYNYGDVSVLQYGGDAIDSSLGLSGNASAEGDLNGDGIKDFIAGGSLYAGANENGRMYVLYGGEFQDFMGTEIVLTDSNETSELFAEGANTGDELANNVVSGGDITGDGIDDAVVAASGYNSSYGITYVIEGAPTDWDADGHNSVEDVDGDGIYETIDDCNDKQATIYVGATETANGFDDDCDGTVDEGTSSYDDDGDGETEDAGDCNDASSSINTSATETCDSVDNDCDGSTDEGVTTTYYQDSDGDTRGNPSVSTAACSAPAGYVSNSNDCNDASAAAYTGATETCDSIDNDCDGSTDEGVTTTYYRDADSDGQGTSGTSTSACSAPAGYVSNSTDCNDSSAAAYLGATEICDSIDNDCDASTDEGVTTTYYRDADSDTYGTASTTSAACSLPAGYVTNDDDCDDTSAGVSPADVEIADDGIDQDCSGADLSSSVVDGDGDGYTPAAGDCNDASAVIHPGAAETCNSIDDDCDGSTDEAVTTTYYQDSDGDTYGNLAVTSAACSAPAGYVTDSTDCNDGDAGISPVDVEIADDGIDQDCSGADLVSSATDADSDGSDSTADCNDSDATIYPGATETCDDGIDQDCDGSDLACAATDADGDGVDVASDCDDTDATVYPGATELADTLDNDCDDKEDEGLVDVQLTSYTTSVNVGDVIPVEYEITNGSGFTSFRAEVLINNTTTAAVVPPFFPRLPGSSFCSAARCTELDESVVTVPVSTTDSNSVNVTIPSLSAGNYVFRVRIWNNDSGQYFDRDINQVITVN